MIHRIPTSCYWQWFDAFQNASQKLNGLMTSLSDLIDINTFSKQKVITVKIICCIISITKIIFPLIILLRLFIFRCASKKRRTPVSSIQIERQTWCRRMEWRETFFSNIVVWSWRRRKYCARPRLRWNRFVQVCLTRFKEWVSLREIFRLKKLIIIFVVK